MTNFDSRRISLVEFYSNDQTLKSILEKSRDDMKKRKAIQGGLTRWFMGTFVSPPYTLAWPEDFCFTSPYTLAWPGDFCLTPLYSGLARRFLFDPLAHK